MQERRRKAQQVIVLVKMRVLAAVLQWRAKGMALRCLRAMSYGMDIILPLRHIYGILLRAEKALAAKMQWVHCASYPGAGTTVDACLHDGTIVARVAMGYRLTISELRLAV